MAVHAVVGYPGSGKSYEVVLNHVLPALVAGRRVVTNLAGINRDAILEYLQRQGKDTANVGEILTVSSEVITQDTTFPTLDDKESSLVKGGDFVVIDEAWRYFGQWSAVSKRLRGFLAEHRHFDNAAGVSCDITWIAQTESMICAQVRKLTELTVKVQKLKMFGLSHSYTANVYVGPIVASAKPIRTQVNRYDKEVFALYASYEGKGGNEATVDKRQNMLRSPVFVVGAPLLLVAVIASAIYLYKFLNDPAMHGAKPPPKTATASAPVKGGTPGQPGVATAPASAGQPVASGAPGAAGASADTVEESDWRVIGVTTKRGDYYVLIGRGQAKRLLVNPPYFNYAHNRAEGLLDGKRVSEWTGTSGGDTAESASGNARVADSRPSPKQ